jgi:hypothetical protein
MKKLFATVALLAAAASPALAATVHRHHPVTNAMASADMDQSAYASAGVYYAGGATSTDPDAFIRRSLLIEGDHSTGE